MNGHIVISIFAASGLLVGTMLIKIGLKRTRHGSTGMRLRDLFDGRLSRQPTGMVLIVEGILAIIGAMLVAFAIFFM